MTALERDFEQPLAAVIDSYSNFLVHEVPADIVIFGLAFRGIDLKRYMAAAETVAFVAGRLGLARFFIFFRFQKKDLRIQGGSLGRETI